MTAEKLLLRTGFLAIGLLLIFQIVNLTTTSMWHDEAFSGLLVQYEDFGEMMYRIGLDVHPPLYYIVLRIWAEFFGPSLFSIRFFSLFFGMTTVAATFLLAKAIFKHAPLAFFAAGLLALSSFQIQYHLEARMYTLAAFFLAISTFFLLQALQKIQSFRPPIFWLFLYILSASGALYTHYYTVFGIFAHGLFVLWILRSQLKKLAFFTIGFFAVALLYVPWLPTFLRQLAQVQENYWIPAMNIWSIPTTVTKMLLGDGLNPTQAALLIIFVNVAVLAAFGVLLWRFKELSRWILPAIFLAPFMGVVLLSLKTSIYLDRYFILYLPFLMISVSAAVFAIPKPKVRSAILFLLLAGAVFSYPVHWNAWNLGNKPGMAGASSYLLSWAQDRNVIIANSSFVYFTFRYYNTGSIRPLLYAPSELPHFSGTALLNEEDITRSFQDAAQIGDAVWTIDTTGFGNFQPAVPVSWQKQEEKEFADAYPHRGSIIIRKYLVQN